MSKGCLSLYNVPLMLHSFSVIASSPESELLNSFPTSFEAIGDCEYTLRVLIYGHISRLVSC